jgi:tetratricopeptide (TPR) repeat protein
MQENYYSNLSKYIPYDKSGRLMLLSGYYFEQKKELKRALAFYKMAYEKNPLDSYNIYAYARAADISGDYKKALELYKKVLREPHVKADITTAVKNRINQLGE